MKKSDTQWESVILSSSWLAVHQNGMLWYVCCLLFETHTQAPNELLLLLLLSLSFQSLPLLITNQSFHANRFFPSPFDSLLDPLLSLVPISYSFPLNQCFSRQVAHHWKRERESTAYHLVVSLRLSFGWHKRILIRGASDRWFLSVNSEQWKQRKGALLSGHWVFLCCLLLLLFRWIRFQSLIDQNLVSP